MFDGGRLCASGSLPFAFGVDVALGRWKGAGGGSMAEAGSGLTMEREGPATDKEVDAL